MKDIDDTKPRKYLFMLKLGTALGLLLDWSKRNHRLLEAMGIATTIAAASLEITAIRTHSSAIQEERISMIHSKMWEDSLHQGFVNIILVSKFETRIASFNPGEPGTFRLVSSTIGGTIEQLSIDSREWRDYRNLFTIMMNRDYNLTRVLLDRIRILSEMDKKIGQFKRIEIDTLRKKVENLKRLIQDRISTIEKIHPSSASLLKKDQSQDEEWIGDSFDEVERLSSTIRIAAAASRNRASHFHLTLLIFGSTLVTVSKLINWRIDLAARK